MIPRLRKSHVFTFESENVQSEDKTQLKPDAGGSERLRSSPFPFKLKEGFRNLWKQLAVRFDGRHCGMRTLSMRRSPPVSSKLLWRFGLSSVADCPAVSWWPPRDRGPVLKCVATDLQTEQRKLWINPVCRGFGGIFGVQEVLSGLSCRARKPQVSAVSSRSQQTLVHISWPPAACFSHLLNISPHIKDCVFSI